jgi:hypothetical protein
MSEIERVKSEEFSVAPNGGVQQAEKPKEHHDKFDEILEKLNDPNCSVGEVSRLITVELGKVARDSVRGSSDVQEAWKQKGYETQVKVLTALAKQLNDTEILSKKDQLNFDGPKFRWVLHEITKIFKQTLEECNFDKAMVNNIILQFGDKMAEREQWFRKEVQLVIEFKEEKDEKDEKSK